MHLQRRNNDALDNLCNSAGAVGARNAHLLYRLRDDSHPSGRGTGSGIDPCDPGTQDRRLAALGSRWLREVRREENKMPLINLVIVLIVVGVALWLINTYIPMASSIKTILNVVVVVAVSIWVLQAVGMWGHITSYKLRN
jgi:hypothetical protein